uniref:Uncharacterized protein n=1 Tax=Glossina pallidipes TaxID=7398 RepID=A0A1A9ZWS8_GLOPL
MTTKYYLLQSNMLLTGATIMPLNKAIKTVTSANILLANVISSSSRITCEKEFLKDDCYAILKEVFVKKTAPEICREKIGAVMKKDWMLPELIETSNRPQKCRKLSILSRLKAKADFGLKIFRAYASSFDSSFKTATFYGWTLNYLLSVFWLDDVCYVLRGIG